MKSLYQEQDFKAVSHKLLSEQFHLVINALREEKKFNNSLGGETWPIEIQTSRQNMLCITRLDEEITENLEKYQDILPSLLDRYKRLFPSSAVMKVSKYKTNHIEVDENLKCDTQTTKTTNMDFSTVESNSINRDEVHKDGGTSVEHVDGDTPAELTEPTPKLPNGSEDRVKEKTVQKVVTNANYDEEKKTCKVSEKLNSVKSGSNSDDVDLKADNQLQ